MSWTSLPAELKLHILQHLLASPSPIDHAVHTDNLVCGDLETLISTNNTELVKVSLEACKYLPTTIKPKYLTTKLRLQSQHLHHQTLNNIRQTRTAKHLPPP